MPPVATGCLAAAAVLVLVAAQQGWQAETDYRRRFAAGRRVRARAASALAVLLAIAAIIAGVTS